MSMKISVIGGVSIDFSKVEPCTQKVKEPVITRVEVGQKVRFKPSWLAGGNYTPEEKRTHTVTGKVVYVHPKGRYFTAEYGWHGSKQRESFKPSQIGKDVDVIG